MSKDFTVATFITILISNSLLGQRTYTARFTETPPNIDGIMSEAEWEPARLAQNFREVTGSTPVAENYAFQMLWDDEALYLSGQSEQRDFAPASDNLTTDFFTETVYNLYFDPNTDNEPNVTATPDAYQISFSARRGISRLDETGRTTGGDNSGHRMAIFFEAHRNELFQDGADWVESPFLTDSELLARFPGFEISQRNAQGVNGSGYWEARIPWTMFDAGGPDAPTEVQTDGFYHPEAPMGGEKWFFNMGVNTGALGGLDVSSQLPSWIQSGDVFASRETGHGILSFARQATDNTCGDFDMDGDVDAADRTIQAIGWTGALVDGGTSTFSDGDCDEDGDVDTADQTGLLENWTGALAGNLADGSDADLRYDPANGNVVLDASDTSSGVILSFVLGTDQNDLANQSFIEPFIDVGTNTDKTTFQIGQTDPLGLGAGPLIDLGNIFPVGLDQASLADYLTLAEYASDLGAGGMLDLVVVPEPNTLPLLILGVAMIMWPRQSL